MVIYDLATPGNPANGPGAELCRVPVTCQEADFEWPKVGTVVFPSLCCVYGPFFAGIEYMQDPIQSGHWNPAVLVDMKTCPPADGWMQMAMSGIPGWFDWDDYYSNPILGYPYFRVNGETQSVNCGSGDPWDCWGNPPPGKEGGGNEIEPNDNCGQANTVQCEVAYCGQISHTTESDWWEITLPQSSNACYCLHVRVFADDTPLQYAYGGGLDPRLFVYASDCATQLFANDDHFGSFPDAMSHDAQYDCQDPGNCHLPGTTLYLKVQASFTGITDGPYLLVVNCHECECPQPDPCGFYKPQYEDYSPNGMPDFDQKQANWKLPASDRWSWSGPVALANCLWWFDSQFESGPVDPNPFGVTPPNDHYPMVYDILGAGIDDHDPANVIPFIEALKPFCLTDVTWPGGTTLSGLESGFWNWINSVGGGILDDYSSHTVIGPEFSEVRDSLLSCQDVILLLGFYEIHNNGQLCHWLGGHYVTAAGVCLDETCLCISDPYFDSQCGVHGSATHNDAALVSGPHGTRHHDKYHLIPNPYDCPDMVARWKFTDYPDTWADLSAFEAFNPISPPAVIYDYEGGELAVMLDAALIICPDSCFATGDINGDGVPLTVQDVIDLTAFVNGGGDPPTPLFQGDLNADGHIDQADVDILDCYLLYGFSCFTQGYPVPTHCCPDTVRGACCDTLDDCYIRHPDNCLLPHDEYQGDGVSCVPNPCDTCEQMYPGDVDNNGVIDLADSLYLHAFIYAGGPAPPVRANADPNGDCCIDTTDIVRIHEHIHGIPPGAVDCTCVNPRLAGDANNDNTININDAVFIISYVAGNGPAPPVMGAADATGDCCVDLADSDYLTKFVMGMGPAPVCDCQNPPLCMFSCLPGDADGNYLVNISDAVFLIAYIFGGGPAPYVMLGGDPDRNCMVNISDAVYLISYIFGGGPAPCTAGEWLDTCAPSPKR